MHQHIPIYIMQILHMIKPRMQPTLQIQFMPNNKMQMLNTHNTEWTTKHFIHTKTCNQSKHFLKK